MIISCVMSCLSGQLWIWNTFRKLQWLSLYVLCYYGHHSLYSDDAGITHCTVMMSLLAKAVWCNACTVCVCVWWWWIAAIFKMLQYSGIFMSTVLSRTPGYGGNSRHWGTCWRSGAVTAAGSSSISPVHGVLGARKWGCRAFSPKHGPGAEPMVRRSEVRLLLIV